MCVYVYMRACVCVCLPECPGGEVESEGCVVSLAFFFLLCFCLFSCLLLVPGHPLLLNNKQRSAVVVMQIPASGESISQTSGPSLLHTLTSCPFCDVSDMGTARLNLFTEH